MSMPAAKPDARSAAHAAELAASAYGLAEYLPREAAEQIAAAVLAYADDGRFVAKRIHREMWEAMAADHELMWKHLHVQLAMDLFEHRCLPVSLPERTVTRMAGDPFDDNSGRAVPDGWPWDMVELRLSVPVRKVT